MDIDFNSLSPEEKAEHLKNNACFYCGKPGHCAAVCHKKARDRGMGASPNNNATSSSGSTCVRAADTTDEANQPLMKATDIVQLLKDNKDHIHELPEETHLQLVDTLMPPGFPLGPN